VEPAGTEKRPVRCASAMLVPASLPRLRSPSMAVSVSDLRRPQLLVLAALGLRMLALSRDRTWGAHLNRPGFDGDSDG